MTTQQMIDAIRKGEKLGHAAMQDIANKLESQHGQLAEYKQHFEYNQDIAAKRDAMRSHLKRIVSAHAALCASAVYWENDGVPLIETAKPDFDALNNTVTKAEESLKENGGEVDG